MERAITGGARPPKRFYRPELDALRFFAFLSVFLAHGIDVNLRAGVLHAHPVFARSVIFLHHVGGFGLSLFFLLSSFLITTLLLLEHERTGTVSLQDFYARRVLRIWPLYLAYMAAAFVIGRFWAPAQFSLPALLTYFTLSANWYAVLLGAITPAVQFLWSISVEEQFYLIWPAVIRKLSIRGIRSFCITLLFLSIFGTFVLAATHSSGINLWFNSVSEVIFFAAGGLFALHFGLKQQQPSWLKFLGSVSVCAICWLVADSRGLFEHPDAVVSPVNAVAFFVLAALGALCLLWGFLHMPRRLLFKPLVYLGKISFGLYVFHGFTLLIGRNFLASHMRGGSWLLATFAITVLSATLSYEYFEKPFLKLKHRFELVHSRTA